MFTIMGALAIILTGSVNHHLPDEDHAQCPPNGDHFIFGCQIENRIQNQDLHNRIVKAEPRYNSFAEPPMRIQTQAGPES